MDRRFKLWHKAVRLALETDEFEKEVDQEYVDA